MTDPASADLGALLRGFRRTAFRLETQPSYAVAAEREALDRFIAGEPQPPSAFGWWQEWLDMIRGLAQQGKTVERVRVLAEPPSTYQRWETWGDRWHTEAGERISCLPRSQALAVGLPLEDWWLFDSTRLVLMRFDDEGGAMSHQLVTDPQVVAQHCGWRDLALRHARTAGVTAA